jgi:mannose-6-phosphate isomerase-like protein (cupin superfamily)
MKIDLRGQARFTAERMAKIPLAGTSRVQLDLYCLEPGQEQKAHVHPDQDKIYLVLEGHGQVVVGDREEPLGPGEAALAAAGSAHGLRNPGPGRMLVVVLVSPPPPHA